jgi:sugar lactone lactonase YvrE
MRRLLVLAAPLLFTATSWGESFYTARPDDPLAVSPTGARADGVADDSDALQRAIDGAESTRKQGVVFVPEGRYRLTKTLYVWPGIRLIGVGATRPVFVLAPETPGFGDPENPGFMVFFAGHRPKAEEMSAPPATRRSGRHALNLSYPWDAHPGTFYSAISNIDLEIQGANPGAVGVRARYAQHCYMSHMDFRIGAGLASVYDGGNEAERVHFIGGRYGVITRKPSPGWQFTLVDATFEGQEVAAIKTHEAGLTLIHPVIRNVPTAIAVDPDYIEQLWIKDGRFEDISGPALIISREKNPRTQISLEDVLCRNVPILAHYRESGETVTSFITPIYKVSSFTHGLAYSDIGDAGKVKDLAVYTMPSTLPADKADLPALPPLSEWVNVRTLGVKGDFVTDDTEAIRKAIAAHRVLYFPQGLYKLTDTITLRPDTVLVGLHPSTTAFVVPDGTPAFQGVGSPRAVLEAPRGGTNIVSGLGISTNGLNPRAVAAKWMAGRDSMMNDVRFLGGHGTSKPDGTREDIYNNTHTADPDLKRRWDGQYPSLWVTDGGGGRFVNIWTPSTFAQAGMLISDTMTEGRVYQMSSEHHVRNELVIRRAANWALYAFQTEEERGESGFAQPIEIDDSHDITIANLNMYRVVSANQNFPQAITVAGSKNIRFRNIHCYSDAKVSFDTVVYDASHDRGLRQREFASLTLTGAAPAPRVKRASTILAPAAKVQRLATGFFNIAGGAVHPAGDFFFVDARGQRIYRWSVATRALSVVRDNPLDPVNLAFDRAGNLMVLSFAGDGTVYTFDPDKPGLDVARLEPQPAAPRPGLTAVLPVSHYRLENEFLEAVPVRKPYQYVSPDGTTFIPAGKDFVTGEWYYGAKLHDVLRGFGLAPAWAGHSFYVSDESEQQTYRATIDEYGTLTNPQLFADRGGEGLAVDARGNVYLAAGQILVYDAAGKPIETIEVPERPVQLAFGGPDRKTLFIAARTSLYAVRTR